MLSKKRVAPFNLVIMTTIITTPDLRLRELMSEGVGLPNQPE
jgi:hypothetical protein